MTGRTDPRLRVTPAELAQQRLHLRRAVQATASDIRILSHRAQRWGFDIPPGVEEAVSTLKAWADSLGHPDGGDAA